MIGKQSDMELHYEIEQFLYKEAELLDDGYYDDWLDLFTDDVRYWMPVRETLSVRSEGVRASNELAIYDDDKAFLEARVERFKSPQAYAEQPPSRTRHFLSNVQVRRIGNSEVVATCNLLVHQTRRERSETTYVGKRFDELRFVDSEWKISSRKIVLDHTMLPRSISVFF
ncbi:MAG: aromatic-ring-hydroxylating dioxygenase subunit beta [Proteobacteria bacterium]|nr:MAG: aromatic-ring-hydroxylating dioxygenase subunit beta [Pseudomonadota bacterium]